MEFLAPRYCDHLRSKPRDGRSVWMLFYEGVICIPDHPGRWICDGQVGLDVDSWHMSRTVVEEMDKSEDKRYLSESESLVPVVSWSPSYLESYATIFLKNSETTHFPQVQEKEMVFQGVTHMVSVSCGSGPTASLNAQCYPRFPKAHGRWNLFAAGVIRTLKDLPHHIDTITPGKQCWARPPKPGIICQPQLRGPPSTRLPAAPPMATVAPPGLRGGLLSLWTPGPRKEGEAGRHCCGFAAKKGAYFGYLKMDRAPAPLPAGSVCQRSATGTCHLRNVFIFSNWPDSRHTLVECWKREGREREGKGLDWSRGLENGLLRAFCAKETPQGLPNLPAVLPASLT